MNASTTAAHDRARRSKPCTRQGWRANAWVACAQLHCPCIHFVHHVFDRLAKWRRAWCCLLAGLAVGLAGCANTRLAATVTRFHQWPAATQGASYAIAPTSALVSVPAPMQTPQGALIGSAPAGQPQVIASQALAAPVPVVLPALEYQTYAAYLEQALQAKGLVPANRPEQARLLASFAVSEQQGVVQERVLHMRPMLWLGYGGFGWRSGFGLDAFYDDYDNDLFGWRERTVTRPVQSYRLYVTVLDRGHVSSSGKGLVGRLPAAPPTVLEAQAQYTGRPVPLAVVMPYLMRAVFEDFPGVSGQTKQVVFDTRTGERK